MAQLKRIVCLSDLHSLWEHVQVPDGDLLIVAGDIAGLGKGFEYEYFNSWLGHLPHPNKVVVAGNHDKWLYFHPHNESQRLLSNCTYLQDSSVHIDGVEVYGSPWTPTFFDWYFMLDRGPKLREKWNRVPTDTDILVTHGPPIGYLDHGVYQNARAGDEELREAVQRVKPSLHVFGHVHGDHGVARNEHTLFVNASTCDEQYQPVQEPIVVDWPIDLGWEDDS